MPSIIELVGAITGIKSALSTPSAPKTPATPPGQSTQTNAAQTSAVAQGLPTLQSLTGGSLSPEYFAQFGGAQAGVANNPAATGNIQDAINKFFGLSAPGDTGLSGGGGGTSITDLLGRTSPAGGASPGGGSSLVDGILNSDSFRGLAG